MEDAGVDGRSNIRQPTNSAVAFRGICKGNSGGSQAMNETNLHKVEGEDFILPLRFKELIGLLCILYISGVMLGCIVTVWFFIHYF